MAWVARVWRGSVLSDQDHQLRMQRQVAVLTKLADRDVQPRCGTDVDHSVRGQGGELADPQPGAQEHLDGDADQQPGLGVGGAEQLRCSGVVECLGQRMVLARQVAGEHRHPRWCLVPAPLLDADEEHPQRPEPVRQRRAGQTGLVLPGPGGEPRLVVLDMTPGDLRDAGDVRCDLDEERRKRPQGQVRTLHAARPQHASDLVQVAPHCGHDLRAGAQFGPGGQQQRPAHRILPPSVLGWAA